MRRLQTKVGRLQTILGNVGGWYYLCSVIMDKWEDDCEVDASFTKWACMDDEGVLTLQRRCR